MNDNTFEILKKAIQNPALKDCIKINLEEMLDALNNITKLTNNDNYNNDEKAVFSFTVSKFVIRRLLESNTDLSALKELTFAVYKEMDEADKYTFLYSFKYENIRNYLKDLTLMFARLMIISEFYE